MRATLGAPLHSSQPPINLLAMLAAAARQGSALRLLLPAATQTLPALLQQERGMKLFEIFSKEERDKRKAQLREELNRGYFDDHKDFRDSKGKVFAAPEKLLAAAHAPAFPSMQVVQSDGRQTSFPPVGESGSNSQGSTAAAAAADGEAAEGQQQQPSSSSSSGSSSSSEKGSSSLQPAAASLVCVAFRAGAQPMLEAWAIPFSQHFQGRGDVALYELAIVEGVVMRMWPFRQMLLRNAAASGAKYALPCRHLHHFGDMQGIRRALHLTNLLTGYVFLVDSQGRLRWRGSGSPSEKELQTLLRCTEELLQQEQRRQHRQQGQDTQEAQA